VRGVHPLDDLWQPLAEVERVKVIDAQALVAQADCFAALDHRRDVEVKVRLQGSSL
jgi:hypothetical protein